MPENTISVGLEIKNQKVMEELEEIISSMEGFQFQKYSVDLPSCDLLILEIGEGDFIKEFQVIHSIQTSRNVREIFLTSSRLDPDLLIHALRAGVKEFFPQPIKRDEVKNALLKFKERKEGVKLGVEKKKRGKIINVIGSKGGVGTTTVAVNLATSLAQSERSPTVALIDMNLLFGEIPIFLNIESGFDWGEVVRNIHRVDSTFLMSILSRHSSGVYILPSPAGLDGTGVADVTPEIIERLLVEMQDVFDFIVIDSGQSINNIFLKTLEISDVVLLIVILSLVCLTNAKRLLWTFQRLKTHSENIHIIINRFHKKSEISLKEAGNALGREIFWILPNDYLTTMSAINRGETLSSVAAETEISRGLVKLAGNFLEPEEKTREKPGIMEKLLGRRK